MNQTPEVTFDRLIEHVRETALLASTSALLEWDERTLLPAAGGPYRAEQIAYLAGLVHRRQTDPQLGEWLQELSDSSSASTRKRRNYHRRWLKSYLVQPYLVNALGLTLARTIILHQSLHDWSTSSA